MTIVHADDMPTFRTEVLDADIPVIVDFWAEWCGPCRTVAPELEALADEYGEAVKVVKVNVDRNGSAAQEYGVMSIPMIGLFEKGDLTKSVIGARPRDAIATALGLDRFRPPNAPPAAPTLPTPEPASTPDTRLAITETMSTDVSVDADGRY